MVLGCCGLPRSCIGSDWNEISDLVFLLFLMLTCTSEWTDSCANAEILQCYENCIGGLRFQSAVMARHVVMRKVVEKHQNGVPELTIGLSDAMK